MMKHLITAAVIAATAAVAAPVFASSSYGPAPHYNPITGAPASQRGQSAQTVVAENTDAITNDGSRSYGGVQETTSQWGGPAVTASTRSLFAHH